MGSLTASVFQLPMGFSLALVGAGYLIGIVGGLAMLFGTFLAWGVAVPYFTATGDMPTDASIVSYAMTELENQSTLYWCRDYRYRGDLDIINPSQTND